MKNRINKLKRLAKLALRMGKDIGSGHFFSFGRRSCALQTLPHTIRLSQVIKPGEAYENKLFNLKKAAQTIRSCQLEPQQILSFWHLVGSPTNGFKESRAIVHGQLQATQGGGLCQLAGILYHAALLARLDILERHAHSVDIYREEERFTPLGTDATLVYGYKDLRIRNPFPFPIRFDVCVEGSELLLNLRSAELIPLRKLHFTITETQEQRIAEVIDETSQQLSRSVYKLPN